MRTLDQLKRQVAAAGGEVKASLVLKNARIINVFTESVEEGDVAVMDGRIVGIGDYSGENEIDLKGRYVCPGFIDGHIHLESAMISPWEFQRVVLPHGTTAVVTDPHEIANVAGTEGIRYMLEATEDMDMDVYFMLPSCVPATALDESGARLSAEDLMPFMEQERVLGLAEMMNAYGIVHGDEACLEKVCETIRRRGLVDGHAPLLSGKALNAYAAAGVGSDHECSNEAEAKEKLARGQWIMIREGTAAKNLDSLMFLFEAPYYQRAMLVTDDKHPGDLLRDGHMDAIIRRAVKNGADAIRAIKMATCHPAQYFGLHDVGAIAPGYQADMVVLEDLSEFRVQSVYKKGKRVAENGRYLFEDAAPAKVYTGAEKVCRSFHMAMLKPEDLALKAKGTRQRVIDLVPREIITKERIVDWKTVPGYAEGVDIEQDIVKLAVFERHCGSGHKGIGFIGNYGLKQGAVATSIGHDSHNLVIAGVNDMDMVLAGNRVIANEGGLAIALDGQIVADLPLVIGGLMAEGTAEAVAKQLEYMKDLLKEMGIPEAIDAFMTLGFVSLPVIPELRLNTKGVIDVKRQQVVAARF